MNENIAKVCFSSNKMSFQTRFRGLFRDSYRFICREKLYGALRFRLIRPELKVFFPMAELGVGKTYEHTKASQPQNQTI